ncbi:hypothetical protein [Pengzhenrongella sp.]|jgi:hypothetical protein|uniref:hypothetical protein n=1 Tax=Pengzhenrongella sp. TaxID=2888820 RepID=UPI002F91F848
MNPQRSAEWIIDQICQESVLRSSGSVLPADQQRVLRTPVVDLVDADHAVAVIAYNNGVDLIRSAIERRKRAGGATVKVRWGLRLPVEWEAHYETVYQSNFPWYVSGVIQSAFLGNPLTGERHAWKSR